MRGLALLCAALLCAGCVQTESRAAWRIAGTLNGQAVELTAAGAEASDTGIDPLATIQAGLAALRGDVAGVAAAVAAQPPPPPALDPAAVAAAVVKSQPPPPAPPAPTVTGSAWADTIAAVLAALAGVKVGSVAHRKLTAKKATV